MLVLCYHNGALGHAAMALLECCTREGNQNFPSFLPGRNLHHFQSKSRLFLVRHPFCDIACEKTENNQVLSSTSQSDFGRFLTLLMGLNKWTGALPAYNTPVIFNQQGQTYGEQLEILSVTLSDKVYSDADWYMDADYLLEILDYWYDYDGLVKIINQCNLTALPDRVEDFSGMVAKSNEIYFNSVKSCFDVVDKIQKNIEEPIDLDFWQVAVCHAKLLHDLNLSHQMVKLFRHPPKHTSDFMEIFNL